MPSPCDSVGLALGLAVILTLGLALVLVVVVDEVAIFPIWGFHSWVMLVFPVWTGGLVVLLLREVVFGPVIGPGCF